MGPNERKLHWSVSTPVRLGARGIFLDGVSEGVGALGHPLPPQIEETMRLSSTLGHYHEDFNSTWRLIYLPWDSSGALFYDMITNSL